jgi:hypothetical protein
MYVEGVIVETSKIKEIMVSPTPKNMLEVISFMGLVGYCIRFIKGFSNIGNHITSLQIKGKKCVWSLECEDSFQKLKKLLTNAPVLNIADPKKDFLVCTNACKEGLSGFLMQYQ